MISSERLNGIRAFVQAEQSGNFARAADKLGLSQSAISKAVARLEDRLGVQLFFRTTRHLSLTDEGRSYYQSCVRALAELEAAEAALADRKASPSGTLRINLPDLFGRQWVLPTLFDLAHEYPALNLEVSFESRMIDLAEEGFDLSVRIGELADSAGLIARKIGVQDLVICGAKSYFASRPAPVTPNDLTNHHCVTHLRKGHDEPWIFLSDKGAVQRVNVRGQHRFASFDVIATAVAAGMGIAQVPAWLVADQLGAGELVPIFRDLRQPRLPIHIVWLEAKGMAPRVRVAVDALVRALRPLAIFSAAGEAAVR
ncbi:MAG: LysR family transcriptional regulator [Nocardioides sp.]